MNKKKKGSTIVFILVIGLAVTTIIGGLISSSVFTTKLNYVEKEDDDLLYAAEGALEKGLYKLKSFNITSVNLPELVTELENETVKKAEFEIEDMGNNTFKIIGRAYNINGNKRVVSSIVKRLNRSSILDYALNANGNITSDYDNRINMGGVAVNAGGDYKITANGGSIVTENVDHNKFDLPNITFDKVNKAKLTFYNNGQKLEVNDSNKTVNVNNLDNGEQPANGAIKFKVKDYVVYLFNADKLIITNQGNSNFEKQVIICTGDIEIDLHNSMPMELSSIFGNNINISGNGQLSITGIPGLSQADVTLLENNINKFTSPSWSMSATEGNEDSSNIEWEKEETVYE